MSKTSTARASSCSNGGLVLAKLARQFKTERKQVDPAFAEHTVEQLDAMIAEAMPLIHKLQKRMVKINAKTLWTKKQIREAKKAIKAELEPLQAQVQAFTEARDAKIPDHLKLPKDNVFHKHFVHLLRNEKVNEAAKAHIQEDREMLRDIRMGLSTKQNA